MSAQGRGVSAQGVSGGMTDACENITTLRSVKIFVLSTLCFRFDLGRPTRAFALRACTLQNGAVAVIFYFLSLIISLSIVNIDDKINLSQTRENLWDTDQVSCHHCCRTMWMELKNWQITLKNIWIIFKRNYRNRWHLKELLSVFNSWICCLQSVVCDIHRIEMTSWIDGGSWT